MIWQQLKGWLLIWTQQKNWLTVKWREHANTHARETGGNPWIHVLIPHDKIHPSACFVSDDNLKKLVEAYYKPETTRYSAIGRSG